MNIVDPLPLESYDSFVLAVKEHPLFRGRAMARKCEAAVWNAAMQDCSQGLRAVIFSGIVSYTGTADPSLPYLRLQLEPMKFDASHRLGRRYGNDRFMELDFPAIHGHNVPKSPKVFVSPTRIVSWLVNTKHELFGRFWKPFHIKPSDKRAKRWENRKDDKNDIAHKIYFFAVDGYGFQDNISFLMDSPPARAQMTVDEILEEARSVDLNKHQPYPKLFARTDLLVSKTTPTVVLTYDPDPNRSQIIYKDDIIYHDPRYAEGEVMTDGAGQMSPELARSITNKLKLSFIPSGFQARIGEAKGFWSVDYSDQSGREWITIYASQRKWKIDSAGNSVHESHRTFEVLRWSSPLKAADLNLQFLPLLKERAYDSAAMEDALTNILRDGLERRLNDLQVALTDPLQLRGWLSEHRSSSGERLKHGYVPYRAGLPISSDEQLILLLDAGFNATSLTYLHDLARKTFTNKCLEMQKRLNITVSKSTYCYMVPDFAGVLEADEVYLDFSSFSDSSAEVATSNILHNGIELLVARSPAHYISDIQKVRAVHKVELVGLKDVIVFSTKGKPSLAAKLSGGDYDGDIAWVCWEPSIVDNFQTADIPAIPDLVAEGVLTKTRVTYEELVKGEANPVSVFLQEAFLFNMQPRLLGICTIHKEKLCYQMKTVNSREATYMSTLLSCLVDQAKQGYIFTDEDWQNFKTEWLRCPVGEPKYLTGDYDKKSNHIIDRLLRAALNMTNQLLKDFHENNPSPPNWDSDLVKLYDWAQEMARGNEDWRRILRDLDADLKVMKSEWARAVPKIKSGEVAFIEEIDRFFPKFCAIRPHFECPLTQLLLPSCLEEDDSEWALLRASAFWATARRKRNPTAYHWNIAGKYLARLKVKFSNQGFAHVVTPTMYAGLKPNASYIKRARAEKDVDASVMDENASVVNADELEDLED